MSGRVGVGNPKGSKKICYVSWCKICNNLIKNKKSKTCSPECTLNLQSLKAKERLRKGRWNTNAQWYESPTAGRVFLESSWEVTVAKELDKNKIRWKRPSYINYTLNNKRKSYYPDFYLIDYNVYLDPKNPYQQKLDKSKLEAVLEEHNIKLLILNKDQLTWNYLKTVVGIVGLEPTSRSNGF